jgi:hypothetical protein
MPLIDLTEIPEAHVASGQQDSFELFASELLTVIGYEIVDPPGRGADLGKDLIVAERRKGIGRETVVRWLVSCKHKAHSGKSVGLDDELNLVERVEGHRCQGFIGFYSTLPSSSLVERLKQLASKFEYQLLDKAVIERVLVSSPLGLDLARRYLPVSAARWQTENPTPAEIFRDKPSICCECCGRDLLNPPQGIFVVWRALSDDRPARDHVDLHWACKGACDRVISAEVKARHDRKLVNTWEDIPDFCIPLINLQRIMAHLNGIHHGDQWSSSAFDKFKTLIVAVYPHIARHATTDEEDRIKGLMRIPSCLGGLGYEE